MAQTMYRGRRVVQVENDSIRVTVLAEGGHIAEILHKRTGVNPLWTPPWPSIEPSQYDPEKHPEYGRNAESRLLAGIMGHNLCLDIFGGPSDEEAAAGLDVHGEASVAAYEIESIAAGLAARTILKQANLQFERTLSLDPDGITVRIAETVENLSATDRPIGWTQHVTLGPPFIEGGVTRLECTATRSKVYETDFTGGKGAMKTGAEFDWPHVPRKDSGTIDLRVYPDVPVSGGYTAHLLDTRKDDAWWVAWSPKSQVAIGYTWRRRDFPWLGIWEENRSREHPPWLSKTITRGMEFGVSPMPETRRQMIERGSLFGVPGFRWIPARSRVTVAYRAFIKTAETMPEGPPSGVGLQVIS